MYTKAVPRVYITIINIVIYTLGTAHQIINVTGKLPIEVDMEAIPQELLDPDSELDAEILQSTQDSPPPLPPKYN